MIFLWRKMKKVGRSAHQLSQKSKVKRQNACGEVKSKKNKKNGTRELRIREEKLRV